MTHPRNRCSTAVIVDRVYVSCDEDVYDPSHWSVLTQHVELGSCDTVSLRRPFFYVGDCIYSAAASTVLHTVICFQSGAMVVFDIRHRQQAARQRW